MKMKNNKGLTLIELLIAIAIAMILTLGIMSLFTSNKRIYREQDFMGRLQENARFAMTFLGRSLRMADHWGGVEYSDVNNSASLSHVRSCHRLLSSWRTSQPLPWTGRTATPLWNCSHGSRTNRAAVSWP